MKVHNNSTFLLRVQEGSLILWRGMRCRQAQGTMIQMTSCTYCTRTADQCQWHVPCVCAYGGTLCSWPKPADMTWKLPIS